MRETIECIFCGPAPSEVAIEEDGWTARQCSSCGLIFLSPRPTAAEIAERYTGDGAHLSAESFLQTFDALSSRLALAHDASLLRRETGGGRLLEIGPGSGRLLVEARSRGFQPYGVEPNPTQAAFIRDRHGIPCVESLDDVATLGPEEYDVVFHRDVLSHFYDPIEEFERLNALLRPGGWHVFETGNFGDADPALFASVKTFQLPDHLFFFSTNALQLLVERTGLELRSIHRYSLMPSIRQAQLVRRAATLAGRGGAAADGGVAADGDGASPAASGGGIGAAARRALDVLSVATRLTVGRVRPDPRDLQTLVVVAQKPR
jgi:SAM-dependent methyltransferase